MCLYILFIFMFNLYVSIYYGRKEACILFKEIPKPSKTASVLN